MLSLPTNPQARKATLAALLRLKRMTPEQRSKALAQVSTKGLRTQPAASRS